MFIPPPPLSREEFDRRVAAGARTFEEIDPEFMAALRASQRGRRLLGILVLAGAALVLIVGIACAWQSA